MIPTLLITLREVIEASLIVATILGILTKLKQREHIRTVWSAAVWALLVSFLLVFGGSTIGVNIQKLYEGELEPLIEGVLFITSAFFVTWAVFVIHKQFARKKIHLLEHVKRLVGKSEQRGIFMLTFTAVFREGIEIVLFLSTMYLTSSPTAIIAGFAGGVVLGLCVSFLFFSAAVRLPVYYAFRATSYLLILFAAGLLARGLGEFLEVLPVPLLPTFTVGFLPSSSTFAGGMIKTLFGVTQSMNALQLISYSLYMYIMHWWVFVRPRYSRGD